MVFTRNKTLFLSTDLRSDAHQSQIIEEDADEDHTQIVGEYTVKLLGGYIPPCFGTTACMYSAGFKRKYRSSLVAAIKHACMYSAGFKRKYPLPSQLVPEH